MNSLAAWSKKKRIPLYLVAESTCFSKSVVYKVSSRFIEPSAAFRLAFLKEYGKFEYKEVFGNPAETPEIQIYLEVVDAK